MTMRQLQLRKYVVHVEVSKKTIQKTKLTVVLLMYKTITTNEFDTQKQTTTES